MNHGRCLICLLLKVRFGNSAIQKPLTHGRFDVTKVHGWNENDGYV